ncbi:hypothetical protein OsI_22904 [Oryza sativa Indica Group]|uniref:Uncharacterized protein n=1 Tax=Oryza sativa subsp. indica TaxID=39946 RepID=A2YCR7_ORYSI|nr:hypothetical protein OsI_22904 [Oryza sativa Indica Group]
MAMDLEMAAASEEAPDSQVDGAPDSVDVVPDSVEVALESVETLDSGMALNSVEVDGAPDSINVVPDSVKALDSEMVLNSVEVDGASDSVETLDSEMAMNSVEFLCARCGTFHASGIFGEAYFQAHRRARSCARCGLLHEDYDMPARWLHDMEKFDCEIYIPDVENLQMDGNTIILPEQVIKKLEEHIEKKKQTKTNKGD